MATLSELRSRIRDTGNVDSNRISNTRLDEIINDAVAEITSSSRLAFAEKTISVTLTANVAEYQPEDSEGPLEKPVLWTYNHPTQGYLCEIKQTTLEGLRTYINPGSTQTSTGTPLVYTIWGYSDNKPILRVYPTPDSELVTSIDCRIRFDALSGDDEDNAVTVGAADAVTYLSLLLSAPYMENDDRLDTWDRMYTRAIGRVRQAHSSARYSGSQRRQMREMG